MGKQFRWTAVPIAVLTLALALSGCARPTGDFGRAGSDPLHDRVMPIVGTARAYAMKEPVSSFNLTDQEQEMRDRVWRYLVSPSAFDWFGDTIPELQRTRILPVGRKDLRADKYYRWLHNTEFASSRVRYARVEDDVAADLGMLPDAFRAICRVRDGDRQRAVAAGGIVGLEVSVGENAAARRAENEMVIGWFVRALGNRYDSYSYALNHLLVETPHEEAVGLDAALSDLAVWVGAADADDFCSPHRAGGHGSGDGGVRSRYLHTDREAQMPPK